ncbi:hypothetical protein LZ30DRAFT_744019 [Colletotrichum cereale]|nr:hypothetical protein LZ30DRAFT_744019 [Colletotrichum cereale]
MVGAPTQPSQRRTGRVAHLKVVVILFSMLKTIIFGLLRATVALLRIATVLPFGLAT